MSQQELIVSGPQNGQIVRSEGIDLQNAIDTAVSLGKDGVEVIRELHEIMKDRQDREAQAEFIRAYVDVKSRLRVTKNRTRTVAGGTQSKYADLPAIEQALKRAGSEKAGFAHYWDTTDKVSTCVLMHKDGHSITSSVPIQTGGGGGSDMDKIKAATFQADRASLIRVWGIGDMTDSQGEDMPPEYQPNYERVTDEEALTLQATAQEVAEACGINPLQYKADMLKWANASEFASFPRSKYQAALKAMAIKLERSGK